MAQPNNVVVIEVSIKPEDVLGGLSPELKLLNSRGSTLVETDDIQGGLENHDNLKSVDIPADADMMADYSLSDMRARFSAAAAQNALDMTRAFKLDPLHRFVGRVFEGPARRITEMVFHYDRLVGSEGLTAGSTWLVEQFARSVQIHGDLPPPHGPLLIVSNHPGLIDAMVIFAQVQRHDLRILAAERPVLRLLPNIMPYLIFVPDDSQRRLPAVRRAAR